MAKFLLENSVEIVTTVNKTTVGYLVDFCLPDHVREHLPMDAVALINGIFLMRFYDTPLVGDRVVYQGYEWRITERCFYPTRYNNLKEPKLVPVLKVEYLGQLYPIKDS